MNIYLDKQDITLLLRKVLRVDSLTVTIENSDESPRLRLDGVSLAAFAAWGDNMPAESACTSKHTTTEEELPIVIAEEEEEPIEEKISMEEILARSKQLSLQTRSK